MGAAIDCDRPRSLIRSAEKGVIRLSLLLCQWALPVPPAPDLTANWVLQENAQLAICAIRLRGRRTTHPATSETLLLPPPGATRPAARYEVPDRPADNFGLAESEFVRFQRQSGKMGMARAQSAQPPALSVSSCE